MIYILFSKKPNTSSIYYDKQIGWANLPYPMNSLVQYSPAVALCTLWSRSQSQVWRYLFPTISSMCITKFVLISIQFIGLRRLGHFLDRIWQEILPTANTPETHWRLQSGGKKKWKFIGHGFDSNYPDTVRKKCHFLISQWHRIMTWRLRILERKSTMFSPRLWNQGF